MALITRAQLDALELKTQVVDVPAWSTPDQLARGEVVQVKIRELTGSERDNYEAGMLTIKAKGRTVDRSLNLQNARARLCAFVMIDDKGDRLYRDNEIHLLGKLPAAGLDTIYDAATRLSGITEDEKEQLEGLAQDFTQAVTNGSGTG